MTNKKNNNKDLSDETMSFNDNCAVPSIVQVDSSDDLKNGIIEIASKEEYIDEP